jgi:hypothetical protein
MSGHYPQKAAAQCLSPECKRAEPCSLETEFRQLRPKPRRPGSSNLPQDFAGTREGHSQPAPPRMLSSDMPLLARYFLFASLPLLTQQPPGYVPLPTFPLPGKMVETPVEHRSAINNQALLNATGASPESIATARISLGALGVGAIVSETNHGSDDTVCGATGNCPTSVYFLQNGHYRKAFLQSGWAYAVVGSGKSIPDLVVMSNMSYNSGIASRFSFAHGTYIKTGCDYVELKGDTENILDPAHVVIQPCGHP